MTRRASSRPRRHRADHGQSTVELALALPLLCVLVLGVLQVALVVRHQLAVQAAARNAARAASAAAGPGAAHAAAHASTPVRPLDVHVSTSAGSVTVTVRSPNPTDVPFIGLFIPTIVLSATASMPVEPP